MKKCILFLQILMFLVYVPVRHAQTQQLNVDHIKISKFKNFPAVIEIQTTQGLTITGEGFLNGGSMVCSPCFSGTLINTQLKFNQTPRADGSDQFGISLLGDSQWIDPVVSWRIPYFYPRGRNIRKTTPASMRGSLQLVDIANASFPPRVLYQAELDLQGTITSELSPLTLVPEIGRKTTEFIRIDIDLMPRVR